MQETVTSSRSSSPSSMQLIAEEALQEPAATIQPPQAARNSRRSSRKKRSGGKADMTPIRQQQLWLAKLLELEDEAAGTTTPGRRRSHSGNRSRSGSASTTMWAGVRKSLTRANTSLPRVHVDC
eukprot:2501388-Prymnesium_polylepis.1